MKQLQDEAYVLRTQELGEADLIVCLVARDHGKVRGVARSARSSRRRFGGALEPLTRVRLSWTEKQGRDLHRLDGLECIRSFSEMQAEPAMQAACAVLSEITEAFSHEGESDLKSFRLLGAVLEALEQDVPLWTAVHYFEYWTLKLHGLLPDHRSCAVCGTALTSRRSWIAPASGVCCDGCRPAGAVPGLLPQEREFLRQVATRPPTELAAAGSAGGALDSLLRGTLESFAERTFRTYRHLRSATTVWRGVDDD